MARTGELLRCAVLPAFQSAITLPDGKKEVLEPDTMAAAWLTHENLSDILWTDSHDPAIIGKPVQWRRNEIQECISIAWMEHWPHELGIRPESAAAPDADGPESA